ncbi:hypothetical protein EVA_09627 [gut metagenome]|uniref:Uncharacterized protein n=1 Tax=gut metagenome TaxID=749906 RepID=J9CQ56_9ZZZZ
MDPLFSQLYLLPSSLSYIPQGNRQKEDKYHPTLIKQEINDGT